ncbi:MAG: response regulator [Anaerolineae bacterium]|nr:response regulator [Anaerolineae bacterium]
MANTNDGHKASILIVEDSPPQALKLKVALENSGCQVYWTETGQGGLDIAQQEQFDLIILDIELPDINGFEVCKQLKANPKLADIPVVMLTTHDHAEDVLNGLEVGAVDYIPKDAFAEAVLLETIKQMKVG